MSGGVGEVTVQAVADELRRLARELAAAGDELAGVASGLDRSIPAVPDDEHGLGLAFVALDEAREQLERHTAAAVHAFAAELRGVAERGEQADLAGSASFAAPGGS